MPMFNPPHPGDFIFSTYLEPYGLSCRYVAKQLDVSPSTLNRLLKSESSISPAMALRLAKTFGRTPESWLAMQDAYDLWHARQHVTLTNVNKLKLGVA